MDFKEASKRLKDIAVKTPLVRSAVLSDRYKCNLYLKREDQQLTRSYKIRGAFNFMSKLKDKEQGVVCASAGNHAQGVAYSCRELGVKGVVFMPTITPRQKINQVKRFGGDNVEIRLVGDTFDDCAVAAKGYAARHDLPFVHPFDDLDVIEGQGTVGVEILDQLPAIDFLILPVGGGGLAAGVGSYFAKQSPLTRVLGVEPEGAASMRAAFASGKPVTLKWIDSFVDGAAVKCVGEKTFPLCRSSLSGIFVVPEGKICSTMLSLYNEEAIVAEPAGAMSVAALDQMADSLVGKTVVCVISGGNNDIDRMPEIKERSLQYEGLKHYFLIDFAQRPGALRDFLNNVLGPSDDIVRFEYVKKTSKERGPALVGVEIRNREDYNILLSNMVKFGVSHVEINKDDTLFAYLV